MSRSARWALTRRSLFCLNVRSCSTHYFKQLFAQVTNPPVDGIREELVMSADTCVGPEANMLEPSPECARQIRLSSPILTNEELEKLRLFGDSDSHWGRSGFKSLTIPIVYAVDDGGDGLADALTEHL